MESRGQLSAPILFMTFNRFDLTKRVFSTIRKAKPLQLFISSDGPRDSRPGEKETVRDIRKWLLKNVDWECRVKTLFRKKNLGCEKACYGAVTWFFKNVKSGIILEDDCLASQSFFRLCQELLEKYAEDKRVTSISALNLTPQFLIRNSYGFMKHNGLWGWASWARAWNDIYFSEKAMIEKTPSNVYLKKVFPNIIERKFFKQRFLDSLSGRVSTWEYPWVFGQIRRKGLSIVPKKNLMENIGVSVEATNTKMNPIDKYFLTLKRNELVWPLKHPSKVKMNPLLHWLSIARNFIRAIVKKFVLLITGQLSLRTLSKK